ncbi:MAG: YmdB family metallophosphoesterase [Clostridia bacterium]|nr:YmdB family metallophosphoesterase [Clostridia bacterium]
MNILCLGDIQFPSGVKYVCQNLSKIIRENNIDFTVINGENTSDWSTLDVGACEDLFSCGADVITGGNHTLQRAEVYEYLDNNCQKCIRPVNLPCSAPGRGYTVQKAKNGKRILVINAMGQITMDPCDSPFHTVDKVLEKEKGKYDIAVCDFHAEATSEKNAFGYYFNGRIQCIFGTHTHVATADERLLDRGSGYITDVGMCGVKESVIGADIETALIKFADRTFTKKKQPSGEMMINGVVFTVDENTNYCTHIKRIKY